MPIICFQIFSTFFYFLNYFCLHIFYIFITSKFMHKNCIQFSKFKFSQNVINLLTIIFFMYFSYFYTTLSFCRKNQFFSKHFIKLSNIFYLFKVYFISLTIFFFRYLLHFHYYLSIRYTFTFSTNLVKLSNISH